VRERLTSGGGVRTPRAGTARAAHHAAGAGPPARCSGASPRPERRGAAQPPPRSAAKRQCTREYCIGTESRSRGGYQMESI
jgi:hypothetical protein